MRDFSQCVEVKRLIKMLINVFEHSMHSAFVFRATIV
jgi:hypothetical protein